MTYITVHTDTSALAPIRVARLGPEGLGRLLVSVQCDAVTLLLSLETARALGHALLEVPDPTPSEEVRS